MRDEKYNLTRFVDAQDQTYDIALEELQQGQKRSHWMWYIFPQHKKLGYSYNAKYYGISSTQEAIAYLEHPVLGQRLREVCDTILNIHGNDAVEVFGRIDAMKLRSSMTLFNAVSPNDVFSIILDKYFEGMPDTRTLKLLEA